jgi:iron(III) transport system substrate-binding protein
LLIFVVKIGNKMKKRFYFLFGYSGVLIIFLLFSGCTSQTDHVNVYSGRHYQADEELFRQFTAMTGIRVNLIKADTDQIINRMELEGTSSPADVLITADAGRLVTAKEKGLLQPISDERLLEVVPSWLRDPDNYWTGLTKRARVIVYNKDRIDSSELSTYEDLKAPKWNGRILVRSSQNHYNQTLLASVVAAIGADSAEAWAQGVVNNMARRPQGNDRDQVKASAAGLGDIAIVNTYYIGLLLNSTNAEERQVARQHGIFFPNQHDRGTHINISGIGIAASSQNKEQAEKLIEFLLSDPVQTKLSEQNFEYPVSEITAWPELLQSWGRFKEDTTSLEYIHSHLQEAMFIFNRVGWE